MFTYIYTYVYTTVKNEYNGNDNRKNRGHHDPNNHTQAQPQTRKKTNSTITNKTRISLSEFRLSMFRLVRHRMGSADPNIDGQIPLNVFWLSQSHYIFLHGSVCVYMCVHAHIWWVCIDFEGFSMINCFDMCVYVWICAYICICVYMCACVWTCVYMCLY